MPTNIPIEVVPYDPAWPLQFAAARETILKAIGPYVERIEHMGSTAVPGLCAKPVIDILIGVPSLQDSPHFLPPLQELGYTYIPEHESEFPERRYLHLIVNGKHIHHLHIVEPGSNFFKVQLQFRDHLRRHPDDAARYAELKMDLAARFRNDREAYTESKSDFIRSVLELTRKNE